MANNLFVMIRVCIGSLFIVSGFGKLIAPYQNFLYVVQSYELFGSLLERVAVHIVPWCELFLGVFLVLGFGLKWVLRTLLTLITMFILILGQALIRDLPLADCGCFGDFISFPPPIMLLFDCALLFLVGLLIQQAEKTETLSLDRFFDQRGG